jgi:uncharacterized Zn finger protein
MTGKDEYGRPAWGGGVAVNGRFVEKYKVIVNSKGEQTTAEALIHVPADTVISEGSKVVFDGNNYRVVAINFPKSEVNIEFAKAYLQKWVES